MLPNNIQSSVKLNSTTLHPNHSIKLKTDNQSSPSRITNKKEKRGEGKPGETGFIVKALLNNINFV